MPFHTKETIRYYTFESLDEAGLCHAVVTRQGGVSPEPWLSLNLGGTVGDAPFRVAENRRRAFETIGFPVEAAFDVWQVHSVDVAIADTPRPLNAKHTQADIILTDRPGVVLFMRFADCVPVILYDPTRQILGLTHAGWLGTARQAVRVAVEAMHTRYHCQPSNLLAAIGPSIAAHHYPVGPEVVGAIRSSFGQESSAILSASDDSTCLDLWQANQILLNQAGVHEVSVMGVCTVCHLNDWYSHRGEAGKTGRFGILACLKA
jgi:YfiH family protein